MSDRVASIEVGTLIPLAEWDLWTVMMVQEDAMHPEHPTVRVALRSAARSIVVCCAGTHQSLTVDALTEVLLRHLRT